MVRSKNFENFNFGENPCTKNSLECQLRNHFLKNSKSVPKKLKKERGAIFEIKMTEIPKFSEIVNFDNCPEMDKLLAIQVTEASILEEILCDKNGLKMLLRAKNQSKTVDDRIKSFFRTVEPIWQAIKQPGAFSLKKAESKKWENDVRNAIITSIFGAVGTVGIDEIVPKGKSISPN